MDCESCFKLNVYERHATLLLNSAQKTILSILWAAPKCSFIIHTLQWSIKCILLTCFWLFLVISSHFWQFLTISVIFWLLLAVSGDFCPFLSISGYFWLFLAITGCFWLLLAISGYFWLLLAISGYLGKGAKNQNGNLRWHLPLRGGGLEGVSSAIYLFWKIIFLKTI